MLWNITDSTSACAALIMQCRSHLESMTSESRRSTFSLCVCSDVRERKFSPLLIKAPVLSYILLFCENECSLPRYWLKAVSSFTRMFHKGVCPSIIAIICYPRAYSPVSVVWVQSCILKQEYILFCAVQLFAEGELLLLMPFP